jgi:HAE1 family hydrophobic/amphiphilic exporter-1
MNLASFAIKKPITIVMISLGAVLLGIVSLSNLPLDLYPDVDFPVLTISTRLPGYSPVHIEALITKPIEEVASTVNNVKTVKSLSREGESEVLVKFKIGTNMDFASLQIREKIDLIRGDFPKDTRFPMISKRNPASNPIIVLTAFGQAGPAKLREVSDDLIKKRLERIPGVANVEVNGGKEREIVVDVEEGQLKAMGLSILEIAHRIEKSNVSLPTGTLVKGDSELTTRAAGEVRSLKEIEDIPLSKTRRDSLILVKDIGKVKDTFKESEVITLFKGEPRVSIALQKESDANTLQLANAVDKEMKALSPMLPSGVKLEVFYNQADYIRSSLKRLKESIFLGGILAMAVLFVFLRHIPSTLIIGVSIPLSVIATFSLMYFTGITMNVISMSGLALGIGMLVDNSIVVLENIFRHKLKGSGAAEAASIGTREVVTAITASTFAHIAVFFPIVFVQKKVQMLYSNLFYTVSFSLVISLLVAIAIVPMLSSWTRSMPRKEEIIKRRYIRLYRKGLLKALRYRWAVALAALVLFGGSLFLIKFIGFESIGAMEKREFRISIQTPPGTKLSVVQGVTDEIEAILSKIPDVSDVSTEVRGDWARVFVRLKKEGGGRSTREVVEMMRPKVNAIPRAQITFSIDRVVGTGHSIILQVNGFDPKKLLSYAFQIKRRLQAVKGVSDVVIRQANEKPELTVKVLHDQAGAIGLDAAKIAHTIRSAFTGPISTKYREKGKEIDVRVRLRPEDRPDASAFQRLLATYSENQKEKDRRARLEAEAKTDPSALQYLLTTHSKNQLIIPLSEVCRFDEGFGPGEIHRKDQQRMVEIQAEVSGDIDLQRAAFLVEQELSSFRFEKGYGYTFGEDYREMKASQREMLYAVILAVLLVYMILASLFESLLHPFTIMLSVPLAAIGVLWIFFVTGMPMNVGVYVGAIALAGIVVNNSIVLVDFIRLLRERGMGRWKAIVKAGEFRLRPILMTSATTVLGLIPMAIDRSAEAALWSPLALTIISGLTVSTVLTLFVVPVVYSLVEGIRKSPKKNSLSPFK